MQFLDDLEKGRLKVKLEHQALLQKVLGMA